MFDSSPTRLSVIIPILNESEGIPQLVKSLNAFFSANRQFEAEVIFVNDGSTDQSARRLAQLDHIAYQARLISLARNFGSHAALRAGISYATGDYITFNYADLQDPLELITAMATKMDQDHDIVWAQREQGSSGLFERMFSSGYAFLMQKFAFANYPEKGFDIVMFNKKVQQELTRNTEANSSVFLQILGLGFRQQTVAYMKRPRKTGSSKWTVGKKIKLLIDSFVAFSFAPIRLVSVMGILFFLFGLLWTAYIIGRKVLFDDLESGWPTLISILLVGFGITNISLGIIAEYLWRTLDASRKRPVYIVDDVQELPRRNEIYRQLETGLTVR